jgi:selenocysteine lyase/cysteine desulfurase
LRQLRAVPGIRVYGETDPERLADRVAVISFTLDSLPHGLVAAILGYEGGVGVRSGCFCAQQYVAHLLGLTPADEDRRYRARQAGLAWPKPGMVRASFGLYNTFDEVDTLVEMLERIAHGEYRGTYESHANGAEYGPSPLMARHTCP